MKKSQLRKIIRESIKQLMNEQSYGAYCTSPGCQCLPVNNADAIGWGLPYNWTGPGQHYNSLSDCLQDTSNCCSDPDQMYSCNQFTGGSCQPDLTGNGIYSSMADCEAAHPNGCQGGGPIGPIGLERDVAIPTNPNLGFKKSNTQIKRNR